MKIKQWLSKIPVFNTAAAATFAASLYYGGLDILTQKAPEPEEVSYSEFMQNLDSGAITDTTINRRTLEVHFNTRNHGNPDGYITTLPKNFDADAILEKSSNTSLTFTDGEMSDERFKDYILFLILVGSGIISVQNLSQAITDFRNKRKDKPLDYDEELHTAYHEAGHALLGLALKGTAKINFATIVPEDDYLGYVRYTQTGTYCFSRAEFMNKIAFDFGGMAAERIIYGENKGGIVGDLSTATATARMMITKLGMGENTGFLSLDDDLVVNTGNNLRRVLASISRTSISNETLREVELEIREILQEGLELAIKTLNENRAALDEIAHTLMDKKTLQAEDIQAIIDKHKPAYEAAPKPEIS